MVSIKMVQYGTKERRKKEREVTKGLKGGTERVERKGTIDYKE